MKPQPQRNQKKYRTRLKTRATNESVKKKPNFQFQIYFAGIILTLC